MEKYTMFSDGKNQYYENDYTTESNLQIQCNPYQITNGIFIELKPKNSQFVWKHKRSQIAKVVLRKENRAGRIDLILDYTTKLQSSRQYSLAQNQKQWSMQQDNLENPG